MPEISIIVPVYNPGKEKLVRCLKSIIEQTFTDYEAILIDDGSVDGTSELLDEFCRTDNRFKVIHQENMGVSNARNKGLVESCGRYICFVDCDDYVKREYLEILYNLINEENIDLAICGVEVLTEKRLRLFTQQRSEEVFVVNEANNSRILELLEKRYFNYVYAKLYSGDIIRKNNLRFNAEFSLGEDTLFVMGYCRYTNHIAISGHTLYVYMKYGDGTLTSAKCSDKYLKLMEVNRCIEETLIPKLGGKILLFC